LSVVNRIVTVNSASNAHNVPFDWVDIIDDGASGASDDAEYVLKTMYQGSVT